MADSDAFKGKNVLVIGGTSGIGGAVAKQFAKRGANVVIAGRNVVAGQSMVDTMRILSADRGGTFAFEQFDASLLSSTKALAQKLQNHYDDRGGLDILVISIGGLSNGVRRETEEGHERYLAMEGYSRYIIVASLIPQLSKSKNSSVWNIKAAGEGDKFDFEDLGLKKDKAYSTWTVMARDAGMNDILTAEYNRRYPEIWFNHVYPGIVKTEMTKKHDLGWFGWLVGFVTWCFGTNADSMAEGFVTKSVMSNKKDEFYWYPKGRNVKVKTQWILEEETGKALVAKMEEATGVKL